VEKWKGTLVVGLCAVVGGGLPCSLLGLFLGGGWIVLVIVGFYGFLWVSLGFSLYIACVLRGALRFH
jgi:hypothetical protein